VISNLRAFRRIGDRFPAFFVGHQVDLHPGNAP
jgi:hypothetical protein